MKAAADRERSGGVAADAPHSLHTCGMCWLRLGLAYDTPSISRMSYEAGRAAMVAAAALAAAGVPSAASVAAEAGGSFIVRAAPVKAPAVALGAGAGACGAAAAAAAGALAVAAGAAATAAGGVCWAVAVGTPQLQSVVMPRLFSRRAMRNQPSSPQYVPLVCAA
jgi:hypothetical protein